MKKLTGINKNDKIHEIIMARKSSKVKAHTKPTSNPMMKPEFQLKLKIAKFFFDCLALLILCHLLNKYRQFGQNSPIDNPNPTRHENKNQGAEYNI
jgi:hypothetical protein